MLGLVPSSHIRRKRPHHRNKKKTVTCSTYICTPYTERCSYEGDLNHKIKKINLLRECRSKISPLRVLVTRTQVWAIGRMFEFPEEDFMCIADWNYTLIFLKRLQQ